MNRVRRSLGIGCCCVALCLQASAVTHGAEGDVAMQRQRMVEEVEALYAETRSETGLAALSPAVRRALQRVERHRLVPEAQVPLAYRNHPLPIGSGQTISQPYIVALSSDLARLQPDHVVLEIGTGSGYQAAVLAEIVRQVYTMEIIEPLAKTARERLAALGYRNITVRVGDGYRGWPEHAPFDAIIVTAAAPSIPQALVDQLKPGARMVVPVGPAGAIQHLSVVERRADGSASQRRILPVRFVPLVPGAPR